MLQNFTRKQIRLAIAAVAVAVVALIGMSVYQLLTRQSPTEQQISANMAALQEHFDETTAKKIMQHIKEELELSDEDIYIQGDTYEIIGNDRSIVFDDATRPMSYQVTLSAATIEGKETTLMYIECPPVEHQNGDPNQCEVGVHE